MERWHGLAEMPPGWGAPGGCVVTVGFFDGVHLGHQAVVRRAVALAREWDVPAVVLTFDPHPSEVVRPGTHPPLLSTLKHRADLMEKLGVDAVLILPFTAELSQLTPEEFVQQVLVEQLHAVAVVVGQNFRFGHWAAGTVETLAELGEKYGFTAQSLPLAAPVDGAGDGDSGAGSEREGASEGETGSDEQRFSSTDVRKMVLAGDVKTAALRLGRPHRVEGIVVRGAQRGREMGFPTANVDTPPHTAIPADGVYAGWLVVNGDPLPAAISIGTNPTFDGTKRTVEAYAIGRTDLELYGEYVAVDFLVRLRGQERFDSMEALVKRMNQDVEEALELLGATEWAAN